MSLTNPHVIVKILKEIKAVIQNCCLSFSSYCRSHMALSFFLKLPSSILPAVSLNLSFLNRSVINQLSERKLRLRPPRNGIKKCEQKSMPLQKKLNSNSKASKCKIIVHYLQISELRTNFIPLRSISAPTCLLTPTFP